MKSRIHLSPTSAPASDPTNPEAIVRVLLEKSPLLVYIANLEFKIVLANRSLREVTGYDTSDTPNVDTLIDAFYPHGAEYLDRVRSIHEGWRRNEHVMGAKLLVQCKNGQQKTIAWYTSRLRIGRGPTVGYVAMGLDLTTQGTLEQWVSLLQRTLQHLDEGVILTDANGSVLAWNEGASRLLGYDEGQMQGQPMDQLFPPKQRAGLVEEIGSAIDSAGRFADELELMRQSGGTRELSFLQVRLDGDGGAPLARLTVLAPPETEGDELIARAAALEAQLQSVSQEKADLVANQAQLSARVSTMDAELATQGAAAGQIADLRGQLAVALADAESAKRRAEELEAAAPDFDADDIIALADEIEVEVEVEADEESETANGEEIAANQAQIEEYKSEIERTQSELTAAQATNASLTEDLAATKAQLEAAQAELAAAQEQLAMHSADIDASSTQLLAVKADLDRAQAESEESKETWVVERSRLEEEHRAQLEQLSVKASDQRRSLEAQLHKDILAAEERAEMERLKLVERFQKEKDDVASAAEIAQAQIESRSNRAIEELRDKLSNSPQLQPLLEPVTAAVVSADTTGKVIGWSAGAAALEGTTPANALGKVIFDEVLSLKGLKWKSLFGKVVVSGSVTRDVELRHSDGSTRDVALRARLIKSDSGAPVGVTVELEKQAIAPRASSRSDAAVLRLLTPFRAQLAAQTAQAMRDLQGTLARVQQIERLNDDEDPAADLSLDGLVAQVAAATGGRAVCELGSDHKTGRKGRSLAALLFALIEDQGKPIMSTVGDPLVTVRGGRWSAGQRAELMWLASEGDLGLRFEDGEARIAFDRPVAPAAEVEAANLELDEPEGILEIAGDEDDDIELDAEESDPDLVRSGRVDMLGLDDDSDLEVFAGEDSVIKSHDALYMKVSSLAEVDPVLRNSQGILARAGEVGPTSGELPPLDDLAEVAGAPEGVSPALLNTANAMDAYVAGNTVADDDLNDDESGSAKSPSEEVLKEMQSTDVGAGSAKSDPGKASSGDAAAKPPSKKRRRSRKRKS